MRWRAHSLAAALVLTIFTAVPPSTLAQEHPTTGKGTTVPQPPESKQEPKLQPTAQAEQPVHLDLTITVLDENGVAVPSTRVILTQQDHHAIFKGETDYVGRYKFRDPPPGLYSLRVEKEGFFAVIHNEIHVGEVESVDVTLNHVREFTEVVNVVYSPPAIDPAKTQASETLSSQEIINLPYTVTRDIRYALPLLPGVLQDAYGQVHVDGSSTRQIFDQLDGFDISDPATGQFNLRVSVDALQSVDVASSRYSAEYGKGSGGVLSLKTGMGDNHFRFSSTDFIPTVQNRKGLNINNWTPRATFSGPLRKDKAWFMEALDGEYDLNIVKELPPGANRNPAWRINNLAKAQVNLSSRNILTTSLVVNRFRSEYAGLSLFTPLEATVNQTDSAYLFTAKDQYLFSGGTLLEAGVGISEYRDSFRPLGIRPYVITPDRTSGNFFETAEVHTSRLQGIANVFLPPRHWKGRHEFKVGLDADLITDRQSFDRRPMSILREDGTLSSSINYVAAPSFTRDNFEASGYAQDRWSLSDRWLMLPGVRFDWDEIVRDVLVSPRLASTYVLTRNGDTKLTWGIGIYDDAGNLDILTRSLTGKRFDVFYDQTGQTPIGPPVETSFHVNEQDLKAPRFLNWSVGLERKIPYTIYLHVQFVQKRGWDGWTFIHEGPSQPGVFSGQFELKNERRDKYDSVEVSMRRTFKGNHVVFASYTRSAARSNAVLNFNIDSTLFGQQAGGPLPWDTPNRFLCWGFLPLPRHLNLAYSADWRDGFPFNLVNQEQQLVGSPGSRRFPTYFSLNVDVERRIRVLGFQWALRVGFNDITNRSNPSGVDSNVDSPHFLTFAGVQGRALTARIRFLGRK